MRNSAGWLTTRSGSTTRIPHIRAPVASRSLGYHTAVAVALALAPLAVDANDEHAFVTQFLAQWGTRQTAQCAARQRRTRT
jgi:hypothetical protein